MSIDKTNNLFKYRKRVFQYFSLEFCDTVAEFASVKDNTRVMKDISAVIVSCYREGCNINTCSGLIYEQILEFGTEANRTESC